jgi:hypothetical protein
MPLAVSSARRSSLDRLIRPLFNSLIAPLSEFHLPLESFPAIPSRPTAVHRLLSWAFHSLQHMKDRRSTCREFASLATFRLQGLATLLAVSSLRSRAGFVSHRQRSWDSPFGAFPPRRGSRTFPHRKAHLPFHPPLFLVLKHRAGPVGSRFLGLPPRECLDDAMGLAPQRPAAPLGFAPSRVHSQRPWPSLHPASSHALGRASWQRTKPTRASESQSAPVWLDPRAAASCDECWTGRPS